MKFLAAIILSISLMATSSFAVSLNAPLVLKMQEDHTMAASDFTTEEAADQDFNPLKPIVGVYSVVLIIVGLAFAGIGFEDRHNEDYHDKAGAMIGGGLGMAALGGLGIWWAF